MRSGWKLPATGISSEFTRNVWQAATGSLAATILIQATALSSKLVDIIFDTYEMPSIKRMERERRGLCDRNYKITGPQQTRPVDFNEALKSLSFKNGVACIPAEWVEGAGIRTHHTRTPCVCWSCWRMSTLLRWRWYSEAWHHWRTGLQPTRTRHPHLPPCQGHRWCWKRQQHHHNGLRYWHRGFVLEIIALGRPTAAWMMCRRGLHWLNVLFQFFFYRDCPNSTRSMIKRLRVHDRNV